MSVWWRRSASAVGCSQGCFAFWQCGSQRKVATETLVKVPAVVKDGSLALLAEERDGNDLLDSCFSEKRVQPQWQHVKTTCEADLAAGSPSGSRHIRQTPNTLSLPVSSVCPSESSDTSVTESMRVLRKSQFIEEQAFQEMDVTREVLQEVSEKLEPEAPLTMGPGASCEIEPEVTSSRRPSTSWTGRLVTLKLSETRAKDVLPAYDMSLRENSLGESTAQTIHPVDLAVHWAGLPKQKPKALVFLDTSQVASVHLNCSCPRMCSSHCA